MIDFTSNNEFIEVAKRGRRRKRQGNRRCWRGYKATPGKTPYSSGSCTRKYQLKF